jgi:hypothetical protein
MTNFNQKICIILYPCRGGGAQDPCTAIIPDLLCFPVWFIIIPDSSTRAVWQLPTDTSSREAGGTLQTKCMSFAYDVSPIFCRFVKRAVKSYDMAPTALLSLRRESCYGFLSPLKIHRLRPGLNLWILGPMASTLPLQHRGLPEDVHRSVVVILELRLQLIFCLMLAEQLKKAPRLENNFIRIGNRRGFGFSKAANT